MQAEKIIKIIDSLTMILSEQNLHIINYKFDLIAQEIRQEGLKIQSVPCKQFYLIDNDLNDILQKKTNATSFEEAAKYEVIEKQLLEQKGYNRLTILRSEPSYFKYCDNYIIGYLSDSKYNERLLINLIEGYNIPRCNQVNTQSVSTP